MARKIYRILNGAALILWAAAIINILTSWASIPEQVPTHYNFNGEPDNWGNKWFVFFPPTIGIVLWLFMSKINKLTGLQALNPNQSSARQIENSTAMLRFLQAEILITFSLLSLKDVYIVKGGSLNLGIWEMVSVLTVICGTALFFTLRGRRIQKQEQENGS